MPTTKLFSLLNIRKYGRGKQEEDPAEAQRAFIRNKVEVEIAYRVEASTSKQLAQWEAIYGGSTSPTSLFHDSGVGSPVTFRKGSSGSEDVFRSQSIDQACKKSTLQEDRLDRLSSKLLSQDAASFYYDEDQPDEVVETQRSSPELTSSSERDQACKHCMVTESPDLADTATNDTTSTVHKAPALWGSDSFGQLYIQEDDLDSGCNISTTPVVDEWLDSSRAAMSTTALSPLTSHMAFENKFSQQDTFPQTATPSGETFEHSEEDIIIVEEDPARLQTSTYETNEAAMIPMYVSPELEKMRVSRGRKVHRTVEWIKHTADADPPVAEDVSCCDPSSEPSACIGDVVPGYREMFEQGSNERRRRRNCVCWAGFVGEVLPSEAAIRGSYTQEDTAAPPTPHKTRSPPRHKESSQRVQEIHPQRQTARVATSPPLGLTTTITTLMSQRQKILAYRNGHISPTTTTPSSQKSQSHTTPTTCAEEEEEEIEKFPTFPTPPPPTTARHHPVSKSADVHAHADADADAEDNMTLSRRRAVLLSRRSRRPNTTTKNANNPTPSPLSSHPPHVHPTPQHARQTALFTTWREDLASDPLPSWPLSSTSSSSSSSSSAAQKTQVHRRREEMRREEMRVWRLRGRAAGNGNGNGNGEARVRESAIREWPVVAEEVHRRGMRALQRGAKGCC